MPQQADAMVVTFLTLHRQITVHRLKLIEDKLTALQVDHFVESSRRRDCHRSHLPVVLPPFDRTLELVLHAPKAHLRASLRLCLDEVPPTRALSLFALSCPFSSQGASVVQSARDIIHDIARLMP